MQPDGSGRRVVVSSPRTVRAFEPAWAPDGNRIAFVNGVTGISVIGADGTGLTRVTTQNTDRGPAWSPDGRRIAFERREGRFVRLFVVNADGSGLRGVTTSLDLNVQDPEWSPDGSRFTFSNGFFDVYVVNADGTGLQSVTEGEAGRASQPSWSPDGSLIAYGIQRSVKVVSPDGGGLRELIGGLREVWELSWSPRGTRIAFINDPGGALQEELYVVNADGSGVTRTGVDTDTDLDWGRGSTVPAPVVGVSVNLAPVSGVVRVRLRGTNRFVSLARLRNVPVGSELDITRGRVRLISSAGGRRTQTGVFYQGRAVVRQPRRGAPVTTMQLSGPLACPRRSLAGSSAPPPRTRRLWGNAKGRFRTSGRFASAVVRGTIWLTEDRCDGTLVRVRQGRVEVFDVVRKQRVIVRAGQSYLARAR